jgi:molybdopterin converting factor small subunit
MMVTVRLFARAKDLAGREVIYVELTDGATVAHLRQAIIRAFPKLTELLRRSAIAVAGDFATDATSLLPEQEIAILPPVSGGIC